MERRLYFVIGDILANVGAGALAAWASAALIGERLPQLLAMPFGMLLGGLLAMVLAMGLTIVLGGCEVMLPLMTTGMLAGMAAPMSTAAVGGGAKTGALVGVVVWAGIALLDVYMHARGERWTG